jgi:conjugal transfer/entry exclusion protein
LNREKLNNYRDVRTLYDKYMKMEQDCQTNLNIAKEWQNEVDRLQGKMEKYQKVVGQLERELKTAKTQANRMSLNTSEVATDKNTSDELLSNDALLKIRQKYPLQRGNSGNFSGN